MRTLDSALQYGRVHVPRSGGWEGILAFSRHKIRSYGRLLQKGAFCHVF